MKKSIAILSIFLAVMAVSCRNENEEQSIRDFPNQLEAKKFLKKGDSITELPSSGNGETEPPRKDLLQWKQVP